MHSNFYYTKPNYLLYVGNLYSNSSMQRARGFKCLSGFSQHKCRNASHGFQFYNSNYHVIPNISDPETKISFTEIPHFSDLSNKMPNIFFN